MLPTVLLAHFPASDRETLVRGVGAISAPGATPGALVASKGAFVVLQSGGKPVFVATRAGRGRALAGGHGAYFGAGPLAAPANGRFLANALAWLGGRAKPRVGTLGTGDPAAWTKATGAQVAAVRREEISATLARLDVLAFDQDAFAGDPKAQATVIAWAKAGHGLLTTGPAWGWQQLNPGKDLVRDLSANRMLLDLGIGMSGEAADGEPSPAGADDPTLQTESAMVALRTGTLAEGDAARATRTIARTLALSPEADGLAVEIRRLEKAEPHLTRALTSKTPFRRLSLLLDAASWKDAPAESIRPYKMNFGFPGFVPAAPRVARTVTVDASVPEWHGTGLYAAPGEVVEVTLPAEAAGKGLGVRIGAHTDELWDLDIWYRFPAISARWPLAARTTRVASAFGGTVFVDVPEGSTLGTVSVEIKGAVPAPRFVRGETTAAEWTRQLAEPGGPWVEIEGRRIVLSLPRSAVKDLVDPEPVMAFWDETFELARALYAAPARPRPERYVADRQISAGYMHSGYPIMTGMDVASTFADVAKLRGKGATWGFFHELGHNFQREAWTFDGTGEVTNNLFSLYASEKLNGITPADYGLAHPAMRPDEQRKRLAVYLAKGARFEEWKADPFLALTMYAQVREAFGWEPFTRAFASYEADGAHPVGESAKRDEWMVRLARAVGRDLGPFFVAWGVPTSEAARRLIAGLPAWMPADWPR